MQIGRLSYPLPSRAFVRRSRHVLAAATMGLVVASAPATAGSIISATVSCASSTCVVEPVGGPVDLDPAGFSLHVGFAPQGVRLLGIDQSDWWALKFTFTFTGTHDGTENFGVVTLLDHAGSPVSGVNPQFDDTNVVDSTLEARYQIFNNGDDLQEFLICGLTLGQSDGSGVRTLQWTQATFSPAAIDQCPECPVPEPSTLLLLGVGLLGAGAARRRRG